MALNINGTTGISGVDGSASAPVLTGTDSNTGINFASDTVNINTGGATRVIVDSSGNLRAGTITDSSGSNSSTPSEIESGRAKAWIKFAGNTTGAILGSYGISSISNPNTGEYTITFSTAFANTNYCVVACSSGDPAAHRAIALIDGGSSSNSETTTTSCGMNIFSTSAGGSHEGPLENGVAFFGVQ